MALVRCPIHKIPYNDENPRGCPACAREKEGASQLEVMQELARVTRTSKRVSAAPAEPGKRATGERPAPLWPQAAPSVETVITAPPPSGIAERIEWLARERPKLAIGFASIVVLTFLLLTTSGPRFVEAPHPPEIGAEPRPLAVEPFAPIASVFSILGPQQPQAVADAPQLARYSYGSDLVIDALNRRVYAISLQVGSRTWRGLRVGMDERTVRGTLALLGRVTEGGSPGSPASQEIRGYRVYPSLDERPRRTLTVEVRPPNGCFDATVILQPRAVGILRSGGRAWAVIGEGDPPLNWVATRIQITSRSLSGPYGGVAC